MSLYIHEYMLFLDEIEIIQYAFCVSNDDIWDEFHYILQC